MRLGDGFAILRVLSNSPAQLDGATRVAIQQRILEAWLAARRDEARRHLVLGNLRTSHAGRLSRPCARFDLRCVRRGRSSSPSPRAVVARRRDRDRRRWPRRRYVRPGEPAGAGPGLVGVVMAPATVDLTSQLDARVRHLRVRPGDAVRAGEVLAELDTTLARNELAVAGADLRSAEVELRRAELEAHEATERLDRRSRTVELPGGGTVSTVSQEELTTARYQAQLARVKIDAARAGIAQKRAHYEGLRVLAGEGSVRAPFDGVISERFVDEGASLRKGGQSCG